MLKYSMKIKDQETKVGDYTLIINGGERRVVNTETGEFAVLTPVGAIIMDKIFEATKKETVAHAQTLRDAIWGEGDTDPAGCLYVHIKKIRSRLSNCGLEIENRRSRGRAWHIKGGYRLAI